METDFDIVAQELTVLPDAFLLAEIMSNDIWKCVFVMALCIIM